MSSRSMNPKEYADPENEPQPPEEVDDVSEDDSTGIRNHERDENDEGNEAKLTTMEERKAKMQQLRTKMVRRSLFPSSQTVP